MQQATPSRRSLGAYLISLLGQAVASATTLLLNLFLVRSLPASEYGRFSIGFTALYFCVGLIAAALTMPVAVLDRHADDDEARYASYIGNLRHLRLPALAAVVLAGAWMVTAPLHARLGPGASWLPLAALTLPAAVAVAVKDHVLRYMYASGRLGASSAAQCVAPLVVGLGIAVFWMVPGACNAATAVGTVGIAAVGVLAALVLLSGPGRTWRALAAPPDHGVAEIMALGRHGIVAHVVNNLRTQGYAYILPILSNLSELARLNAARIVIAGSSIAIQPLSQIYSAEVISGVRGSDRSALRRRHIGLALLLSLAPIVPMWFVLHLMGSAITTKYGNLAGLAGAWSVYLVVMIVRTFYEAEVISLGKARVQSGADSLASVLAIALLWPLYHVAGIYGVILALILSELVVLPIFWRSCRC